MHLIRRELKYQIPSSLVQPISDFVERYCVLDKYSQISHDLHYTINSLYLDNEDMYLLEQKRNDQPRRFSMRIRSYGDNPVFPAFIEIKKKTDQFIDKKRAAIRSWDTVRFLLEGQCEPQNQDIWNPTFRTACFHILQMGLRPKMMTQYRRKAYMGSDDPYSRVTFDKQLRCYREEEYRIFPDFSRFTNYDHEDNFDLHESYVVLELKCEERVPFWMSDLIRYFGLRQAQFSKFDSSWTFLNDFEYDNELLNTVAAR